MMNLRSDNERLREEQENILWSLSNRQKQQHLDPSVEDQEKTPITQHGEENFEYAKKQREDEEGRLENVSDQWRTKKRKIELQGELKKN